MAAEYRPGLRHPAVRGGEQQDSRGSHRACDQNGNVIAYQEAADPPYQKNAEQSADTRYPMLALRNRITELQSVPAQYEPGPFPGSPLRERVVRFHRSGSPAHTSSISFSGLRMPAIRHACWP